VYYVTIGAFQGNELFGAVFDGRVDLTDEGRIAQEEWLKTPLVRPNVSLDAYVVMPNHLHGIVIIHRRLELPAPRSDASPAPEGDVPALHRPHGPRAGSLGAIVGQFKGASMKRINALWGTSGVPVWHRNYFERIVRDDRELDRVRRYIAANPARWDHDRANPTSRVD
jgi:REP element-mobilizing transposase RayT